MKQSNLDLIESWKSVCFEIGFKYTVSSHEDALIDTFMVISLAASNQLVTFLLV